MLTVDGRRVASRGSVLDACREAGADVPAFCHDAPTRTGGCCRACLVEVDGRAVTACTTPAEDGARVRTDTVELRAYRRDLMELMLTAAAPRGATAATAQRLGARPDRYGRRPPRGRLDASHPYLRLDLGACTLCRRCVEVCEGVEGRFVFAIEGRGARSVLSWGEGDFVETDCSACGSCAEACPTDAITDVDRLRVLEAARTEVVPTTCGYCAVGCALRVRHDGERILQIDGDLDSPVGRGHLCAKGRYAHGFLRAGDRLTTPMIRRDGELVPCGWPEAIRAAVEGLTAAAPAVGALVSARCTNEEVYLVQKWLRAGLGSNDVDSTARACHAPTVEGLRRSLGLGAGTGSFADIELADVLLVVGADPTDAHPVVGARVRQRVLDGAALVVVDPRRTELAELADVHLRLDPGTNVALLNALACALVEAEGVDVDFVTRRTTGWAELRDYVMREFLPERTEAHTGVPGAEVRRAADLLARARRPLALHGLGLAAHHQGTEGVMALCNLMLLLGAVGRPGTGLLPLFGQNNAQGAMDMGGRPDLAPGSQPVQDPATHALLRDGWGADIPPGPGRTARGMLEAARAGELEAMFLLGEDPLQTAPDLAAAEQALDALDFLVVQELFLTETARRADVVLPGAAFFEKDGTFTSAERRVQRVRRVVAPPGEARADLDILLDLLEEAGFPQAASTPEELLDEIARSAPDYAGISAASLGPSGTQWPLSESADGGTATLHEVSFPIGHAELFCLPFVPPPAAGAGEDRPFNLLTGRVLEHFNGGSMTRRTDQALLRGEDRLEIHPADAASAGLADGEAVIVRTDFGEACARLRFSRRMARGDLFLSFHFPETDTNRAAGVVLDRLTGCPQTKLTPASLRRARRSTP